MPYDNPVTSASTPSWTLSSLYGTSSTVALNCTITVEGSAIESDADAALQELVDALTARPHFNNIAAVKTYASNATQNMLPS